MKLCVHKKNALPFFPKQCRSIVKIVVIQHNIPFPKIPSYRRYSFLLVFFSPLSPSFKYNIYQAF